MKVTGRWMPTLGLAACLMAGCKKNAPAVQPEPTAPAAPAPSGGTNTPPPATPPAPEPAAATPPAPTVPDTQALQPQDAGSPEWTAGIMDVKRQGLMPVTLREVRSARNEGFDRVVFQFEGGQLPGYHLEYVDSPVHKCGSGDPTDVAGQGWLEVRIQPARAHANGQVTVADRERKPGLPVLQELELTCDFEGDVTWVLGVQAPNRYRVLELENPTRLVVDVRH